MIKKERNIQFDIVRGIGIILIVLSHTQFPYRSFLYLFHLAIFFIMSGYLFKEDYVKDKTNFKAFIINKFKRLYLPYVIAHIILILLNNCLIHIKFYNTIDRHYFSVKEIVVNILKSILLKGNVSILGLTWFIPILFIITITYGIIEYIIKKYPTKLRERTQLILSIILFALGYYLSTQNIDIKIMGLQVLTCYILFYLGRQISKYKMEWKDSTKAVIMIVSFIMLIILNKLGKIELARNQYTNLIYFMSTSICGWIFIFELSYFISKIKGINTILQYIGRNTMSVVIGQFIVFEILLYFDVKFKWWIIYTLSGVLIPIIFNQIKNTLKLKIMKG